ncbi:MAG: hypothetical protein AB8G22_26890 [Saprospiraceae bacterium]
MSAFSKRSQIFTSLPFILALTLLLLNDFYWKATYANFWTGKISDFAGLFVFILFWSTLFPKRKTTVYFLSFWIDTLRINGFAVGSDYNISSN